MNADQVRVKRIPVMLDKERNLVMDLNAFCALEQEYGSIDKAFTDMQQRNIGAIRAILWAGVLHEYPEGQEPTPKEIAKFVGMHNLQDIVQAVSGAFYNSLPVPNESETPEKET